MVYKKTGRSKWKALPWPRELTAIYAQISTRKPALLHPKRQVFLLAGNLRLIIRQTALKTAKIFGNCESY